MGWARFRKKKILSFMIELKIVLLENLQVHIYEIGENFYSTTEEENLDIGEWFFIVDLDDYLTR